MDLAHLFESEETDRAARLEAVMVFSRIRDWLSEYQDYLAERLQTVSTGRFAGSFVLNVQRLEREYTDLFVIFAPKGEVQTAANGDQFIPKAGLGISADGHKFIVLRCLIAPHDTRFLDTRFGAQKWNFVHEFMHYLMRNRANTVSNSAGSAKQSLDAYYNNPDETNAYYQEMAQSIVDIIRGISQSRSALEKFSNMTTPALAMRLKGMCGDRDMLASLSAKNMRALDKRLVRFVDQTIRPMLDSGLANATN